MTELREQLAAIEHDRWAHWQRYMHSKCDRRDDGSLVVPAELVERWERQIATSYADLSEREKASDLEQVDLYWPLVQAELGELQAAVKRLEWQLSEAQIRIEGWERIEERISHHIPEHYEAGYNSLEDWANDANAVVMAAHAWRKCGRSEEDAAKLDAAVEKIYPSEDYV